MDGGGGGRSEDKGGGRAAPCTDETGSGSATPTLQMAPERASCGRRCDVGTRGAGGSTRRHRERARCGGGSTRRHGARRVDQARRHRRSARRGGSTAGGGGGESGANGGVTCRTRRHGGSLRRAGSAAGGGGISNCGGGVDCKGDSGDRSCTRRHGGGLRWVSSTSGGGGGISDGCSGGGGSGTRGGCSGGGDNGGEGGGAGTVAAAPGRAASRSAALGHQRPSWLPSISQRSRTARGLLLGSRLRTERTMAGRGAGELWTASTAMPSVWSSSGSHAASMAVFSADAKQ